MSEEYNTCQTCSSVFDHQETRNTKTILLPKISKRKRFMTMSHVCVVGGGVVGLTTAVAIQQQNPKCQVRLKVVNGIV